MLIHKDNLTTASISEFNSNYTIYIRDLKGFGKTPVFCQFMKFEGGRVYGKVLVIDKDNPHQHSAAVGGVPCTIKWLGARVEETPYESKREQFQQEFKASMKNYGTDVDQFIASVENLMEKKGTLTKTEREYIIKSAESLRKKIQGSAPFIASQFNEQMDRTTLEAKGEIEAFFESKVRSLGLEAFQDEIKGLLGTGAAD